MAERNSVDVTFSDIAKRSGVNSALIQYYFGSKSGLFMALLERDAGPTFDSLDKLVSANIPAPEKLRHHVSGVIKVYHRYPYMNRLIGSLSIDSESEAAQFIAERFTKPLAAAQSAILEQGEDEGVFHRVDPMLFHFSLIGSCDHLFHARHSLKFAFGVEEIDEDLQRRYAQHISKILLESIMRR